VRVLSITTGADPAGISGSLVQAFRDTDITLRSAVRLTSWLDYPHDLPWSAVEKHYRNADVVHLHQSMRAWRKFGSKPFVLHHHGTKYRNHHEAFNAAVAENGGVAVVSTLDLLDYGDNLTWCPTPVNIPHLETYRAPVNADRLRIGHAPTNRSIKDTDAFLAACARLNVEPVLIERKKWRDCLAIKGTVDIYYDQVQLGYGSNAIEAWAMGIPVIAGASGATMRTYRDTFARIPFVQASAGTIADAIRTLMDPDTREEWAVRGKNHAHRWHSGAETVTRLTAIYRGLV